jgi:DNA polymerase sigma
VDNDEPRRAAFEVKEVPTFLWSIRYQQGFQNVKIHIHQKVISSKIEYIDLQEKQLIPPLTMGPPNLQYIKAKAIAIKQSNHFLGKTWAPKCQQSNPSIQKKPANSPHGPTTSGIDSKKELRRAQFAKESKENQPRIH